MVVGECFNKTILKSRYVKKVCARMYKLSEGSRKKVEKARQKRDGGAINKTRWLGGGEERWEVNIGRGLAGLGTVAPLAAVM